MAGRRVAAAVALAQPLVRRDCKASHKRIWTSDVLSNCSPIHAGYACPADDYKATPASRVESGEAMFAIAPSGAREGTKGF